MPADIDQSRAILINSEDWPHFYCPVRRPSKEGFPEVAVVTPELRLLRVNLFESSATKWEKAVAGSILYHNVDVLLADGWRVD
jgi:hypothetical protein